MSDSSFRGITPVTARSSMTLESPASHARYGRKLRLRVVSRHPLPELHFLAPFDHEDPECFHKLQRFVHSHIVERSRRLTHSNALGSTRPDALRFQIDDFEVPFDDPEILRDGDTIEVHLDEQAAIERNLNAEEEAADLGEEAYASQDDSDDEESDEEEDGLAREARDAEERDAVLQATRIAALLRAGIHNNRDNDDDVDLPAKSAPPDDLPRIPTSSHLQRHQAPRTAKPTSQKVLTSNASLPLPFPTMPLPSGGGAAAAMAAFDAKRRQMQLPFRTSEATSSPPISALLDKFNGSTSSSRSTSTKNVKKGRQVSIPVSWPSSGPFESESSDSDSSSESVSSSSEGSSSAESSSSSSESDSDTGSDTSDRTKSTASAPSEEPTYSDRYGDAGKALGGANGAGSDTPVSIPPGQGTNRTKRRNQMRRKKLQLLRDAENLHNFHEARQRAMQRERAESLHDGEFRALDPPWVEDRTPMYRIKGVGLASSSDSNGVFPSPSVGCGLPPGGGSLGAVAPSSANLGSTSASVGESGRGAKRKRDDVTATVNEDTPALRPAPKLQDMEAGSAPFGGDIPAGMSIRHVDCQAYYDQELAKLGGEFWHAAELPEENPREARSGGEDRRQGHQHHFSHAEDGGHSAQDFVHLDYGRPDEDEPKQGADEGAPRKKIKVEPPEDELALVDSSPLLHTWRTSPSSGPSKAPHRASKAEGIDQDAPLAAYPKKGAIDPADVWERIHKAYKPWTVARKANSKPTHVRWDNLLPGMSVLYKDLALDPVKKVPGVMDFIGVVTDVEYGRGDAEGVRKGARLTVRGPLLDDNELDWSDYEPDHVEWTKETCPELYTLS